MNMKESVDSVFNTHHVINCKGQLLDLSYPRVMGILNVTPDSFFDSGKFTDSKAILKRTGSMIKEGADIIDVGGQTSKPGAKTIGIKTELRRVLPAIKAIKDKFPNQLISIDTYHAEVAYWAVEAGASMVNDISGGNMDKTMLRTVGKLNVPYVLMHMQGTPSTMQQSPKYKNLMLEILNYLQKRLILAKKSGIKDIIVDPGFGFGKTLDHNYELLRELDSVKTLGCPILVGLSRKSMIYKHLNISSKDALNGTTALNMVALKNGAKILRVHDVREARETVCLFNKIYLQ